MHKFAKIPWEQIFFGIVGLAFLAFCFWGLWTSNVAAASATFAMAFFSFIYSNMTRFKKFKGLGFEAELWEGKQEEAEHLINKLKSVVSVYTREIVLGKIMAGQLGKTSTWLEKFQLLENLVKEHSSLGQKIDFEDLKKEVDGIFIFDVTASARTKIAKTITQGYKEAEKVIFPDLLPRQEVLDKVAQRQAEIGELTQDEPAWFEIARSCDLAAKVLNWAEEHQRKLNEKFDVRVVLDVEAVDRLKAVSQLYRAGPLEVTDDLLGLERSN